MDILWGFYYIAVVCLIFSVIWKLISFFLVIITVLFNDFIQKILLVVFGALPIYFEASLILMIGNNLNNGERSYTILIIGFFFLFIKYLLANTEGHKNAQSQEEYNIYTYKNYSLLLGLIFFIYSVFNTRLVYTEINMKLMNLIIYISDIPILKWIIFAFAILYMLYITIIFLLLLTSLFASFIAGRR